MKTYKEFINEASHYMTTNLLPGKIYEVTESFELYIKVDEKTIHGGNVSVKVPIVKKINTKIGDTISTPNSYMYARPLYNNETTCYLHDPEEKFEGIFVKTHPITDNYPLDKMNIIDGTQ